MTDIIIQDYYPDDSAVCYGCGRNNPQGLHVKTHWDGEVGTLRFKPLPHHTAFPGYVYGGIIASLIDCHSMGTATAAAYQKEGRHPGTDPEIAFVTANIEIRYQHPTPMGVELVLTASVLEQTEKKSIVRCVLHAGNKDASGTVESNDETACAIGTIVAVRVPSRMTVGAWKKQ